MLYHTRVITPFITGKGLPRMILSLVFQSFPKVRIGGNGVFGVYAFKGSVLTHISKPMTG